MSYNLYINNEEYIVGEIGVINTEFDISKTETSLQGFYYGSSSCIRSDGLGWIVHFENIIDDKTGHVKTVLTHQKKLKLDLYQNETLIESIEIVYPFEGVVKRMEVNGNWIKSILFRDLHRWGIPTPLEVSGIIINKVENKHI